ncbi:hypothetical protein AYO48_03645 [Gaiella sp. SCGC AG-212-M14]|nr:hypothetical protein AYO48_03645 [Gaiella sp. SCGC AG-212-M14]
MGRLVAAGGVMLDEDRLRPLARAVDELCEARGVPNGTELKWSPPRDNWLHDNLHGDERAGLFCDCLKALAMFGGRAVVVVWDTARTTLQGEQAFRKAVEWALERFVMQLSADQLGAVIADRPGGNVRDEDELLADAVERIERGTPYVALSEHIAVNLLTTPSHLSRHVQLADLVAGSTTGMVGGNQYAPPVFQYVVPLLVQAYTGARAGAGLKLFPDELTNLYLHLLGENQYWSDSRRAWIALPSEAYPYASL